MDLLVKVRGIIRKYGMLTRGDKVVVSVSGGPDSVALIHLLHRLREDWGLSLVVAHFNHGLRGEESDRDAEFVRQLAKTLTLPCRLERGDALSFKYQMRLSTEEAARVLRYRFLEDTLRTEAADRIALGHTADDQAEGILIRMLRGSGRLGLCGMQPVRNNVLIRPLIEVSKAEIDGFLGQYAIPYVTDSSNMDRRYLRNKIRLDLIPLLERMYNPHVKESLFQIASILADEEDYLQGIAIQEFSEALEHRDPDLVVFNRHRLLSLHKAIQLRLIRKAIETIKGDLRRISFKHILAVLRLAGKEHPSKILSLPGGLTVRRNYQQIIFERGRKKSVDFLYEVSSLAPVKMTEVDRVVSFKLIDPSEVVNSGMDRNIVYLDYDKLPFPLAIRNIRASDRFRPLGMKGFKKLKDFFIDCKIPRARRKSIPILMAGHDIAWIAGLRIDDRVKLTNTTKRVLRVKINPPLDL